MSQRRTRKPQCSQHNCGSRHFHVADDGFTYCDQGHQQSELGAVVAEDTGELITLGKISRRRAESDNESQMSRVSGFSGTRAFEHYLLCLQLVLRKQLKWLVATHDLPKELESVVRDLWALHLQRKREKASNDSASDTEAGTPSFSSQTESATDGENERLRRSRRKKLKKTGPNIKDTVSLIYIGVILLRIPLTISDFHHWIDQGVFPYYRASKELPLSMVDRLPGEYQRVLEPQHLLRPDRLHRSVLDLLSILKAEFGMVPPPLNESLILYRWIKTLGLPLETYVAAQRLGRILRSDSAYSVDAPAWSNVSLRCPEIRLMGLVIIATKLLFPFDNCDRYPSSARDLAALKMNWDEWVQIQSNARDKAINHGQAADLAYRECFTMTEEDAILLADERLDQYMDWCERNIASEEVRERGKAGRDAAFRKELFRLFPANDEASDARVPAELGSQGETSTDCVHLVQSTLRSNRVVMPGRPDTVPRSGYLYPPCKAEEELIGIARPFYEQSARLAGCSLATMTRTVFSMERKYMLHDKALRRDGLER